MEIIKLSNLEFILDEELFYEKIRLKTGAKRAIPIERILAVAKNIPRPKVLYGVVDAKIIDEEHFSLEDIIFSSKICVKSIKEFGYVIPNIVTGGSEVEDYCMTMKSMLDQYIIMELCNFSYRYAAQALEKDLKTRYKITKKRAIYPGEKGFLLESGKKIFELFKDVKKEIGVSITSTGFLNPSRTAYSLYFGD